ncbi:hypothetical protein BW21_6127 [Burkholderia humptydooensis]|nr:hypothetical protein BW21_6127 [Burkholderia sp. 2002721687]
MSDVCEAGGARGRERGDRRHFRAAPAREREAEQQRDERGRAEAEARCIERARRIAGDVGRQPRERERARQRGEREHSRKHSAPRGMVDDHAAERGRRRGNEQRDHHHDRCQAGARFARIGAIGHRLAHGNQQAAAEPLHEPRREQRADRLRARRAGAAEREHEQRRREQTALAEPVREPRAERNHDGEPEHVEVADPRELRDRCVQLALQRRVRGVDREHVREVDREAEQIDGGDV